MIVDSHELIEGFGGVEVGSRRPLLPGFCCSVEPPPGGVWGSATGTAGAGTATTAGWDGTTGERLSGVGCGAGEGVGGVG
jgi:hypothetical protein